MQARYCEDILLAVEIFQLRCSLSTTPTLVLAHCVLAATFRSLPNAVLATAFLTITSILQYRGYEHYDTDMSKRSIAHASASEF